MRKLVLLIFTTLFLFHNGFTQPYGNEWIHYNQTYLKFKIYSNGIYRINYSTFQNAGVPLTTVTGANFQVFGHGHQIPIYVSSNGILSNTDYIEFYATANDGSADSALYFPRSWQANDLLSLFNDTISYFLTWNNQTNNLHYSNYTNTLAGHPAAEAWCWYNSIAVYGGSRTEENYSQGKPAFQGQPIFNSDFSSGEGYFDYPFKNSLVTKSLYTPYPYPQGSAAELKTEWVGKFPTGHDLTLSVGGQTLQTYTYFGFLSMRADIFLPSNSLLSGSGTTVGYSTANSTISGETNGVSYTELKYPRQFNGDNQTSLLFSLNASGGNKFIELTNFNSSGTTPVLYDMTNNLRLTAIVSTSGDTLEFQLPSSSTERQLLLVANTTTGVINTISSLKPVHFVDYSQYANQGDFIIISHPFFFNDGNGNNYVDQYRQFKDATGYHAIVADITTLYDEFAYGIDRHPLSIKNFSHFIKNTWGGITTKHIFLIGKGIEMYNYNYDTTQVKHCYVPTYGYPGSDVLLTSSITDPTPQISIGRIPALTADQVRIYLKKAEDFVSMQNTPHTIADRAWMKRVLHLGGGETQQDQSTFQYYLNSYIPIIDTVSYGGAVTSFFKTSSDPIQQATSAFLDSLIDNGVSLINFFGHSSYNSFDFNLENPDDYTNNKKYFTLISNGCLVGNMFNDGTGVSDEFVFAENRGAIAFIAAATFSVSNSLDTYTTDFYENLSRKSYNQPLGILMKNTIHDDLAGGGSGVDSVIMEQMCLDGDPSLLVNSHPKPDYDIEPSSISFNPSVVSAGVDSFKLQVIITNLGKAIKDSFYVDVTRTFSNGSSSLVIHKKVPAPFYIDTVTFNIQTQALTGVGLNKFDIKVDATNHIDEESKSNNEIVTSLLILSDDLIPVYPYDCSIVGKQGVTLKASTVNAFAAAKQYVVEIDTTALFNSPLIQKYKTTQVGGIVKWTPSLTYKDSVVYYWRTSLDTLYKNKYSWHQSSFIYISKASPGWNQSHYFQYLNDNYGNELLPSTRKFAYTSNVKTVSVFDGITQYGNQNSSVTWDQVGWFLNSVLQAGYTCGNARMLIAVIDSSTGLQWTNPPGGKYGSINCETYAMNCFYYNPTNSASQQSMANFIADSIPSGDYVLVMSIDDPQMYDFSQTTKNAFITNLGATTRMDTFSVYHPYVLFSRKRRTNYPATEIIGKTYFTIIDTSFVVPGLWDKGYVESPMIGPAEKWTSLHWRRHQLVPGNNQYTLSVYGVNNSGVQTLLIPNIVHSDTSISNINAKQYPYLLLELNSQDTTHHLPEQLDCWRVIYQPVPEAALNPFAYSSITDTVQYLQKMKLNIAVENVSDYSMDSLTMKYTLTDAKNVPHIVYAKLDSLRKGDTLHTNFSYAITSGSFQGFNNLVVEANPLDKNPQPEQFHFNNLGALKFYTSKDVSNPLMDVTFDGVHILDGDIVSAKPDILIRLKSDNTQLALNDTSLFKIYYVYPDGSQHRIQFDNVTNIFTPADPSNLAKSNVAQAELKPILSTDGTYQLFVQGFDRDGNAAGSYAYQISFEIINKSMISDVLTYPNPFTTQTRFVFVLTGSEIPTFMKIQILTVSGKVVKEIFENQLGPIHIGRNISEYAWDGTDQFGGALANGLYIYRVVTNLDNKQLDTYETGTDKYFKHNLGKMYLMR